MAHLRSSGIILVVTFLFISNNSNAAITCAPLKSVSAGETHTLTIADDNSLFACGRNVEWQAGLGSRYAQVSSLRQVKGQNGDGFLKNIVSFDAGWKHSLAADINGSVWSWGWDDYGQLGNGSGQDNNEFPDKVKDVNGTGFLNHIIYVSAGRSGEHSLAVDSNGYVYAWGRNQAGQCGDGTYGDQKDIPVRVLDNDPQTQNKYLGDVAHIIKVDAGVIHSLALDSNGYVWHWGSRSSTTTYPEKVKEPNGSVLTNIIGIASCDRSIAVDSNGYVWEWYNSDSAYRMAGLQNIAEVSVGYGKSTARTRDGFVLVWDYGQSPEYVTDGQMQTQSGLLEGIISITRGYYEFELAIDANGRGWGWGDNDYGQLGIGDTTDRTEPTLMSCAEVSDSNGIIYVDKDATDGNDDGSSWDNAYIVFEDSLYEAEISAQGLGSCEIWVAGGTYKPPYQGTNYQWATYQMRPGNIAIRGHFGGKGVYETSPNQRNFNSDANETIFDGRVGPSGQKAYYTVTCDNIGDGLILDGFTFTGAGDSGLYINNYSGPSIIRCRFKGNGAYGIYAINLSYPDVTDCVFLENSESGYIGVGLYSYNSSWLYVKNCVFEGNNSINSTGLSIDSSQVFIEDCNIRRYTLDSIYCSGDSNLTVIGSKIENNGNYGIYTYNCQDIVVKNNWIYLNGDSGYDSGLYLGYSIHPPFVRNNTVVGNFPYGVYVAQGRDPCLINDIIWQNGTNVFSESGLDGIEASYNCIEGGFQGTGNIDVDPCFVNANANDYHLKPASLCIDAGDPYADYSDETDIDGQCRVIFGKTAQRVDIGADEYFTKADYNGDSIVNFNDFAILAAVWKSTNNPLISLDEDSDVDINDLKLFCYYWLWYAPCFPISEMLAEQSGGDSGMAAGAEESVEQSSAAETVEEPVTDATSAAENPADNISQPVSDEQIQILIDWAEQIWQDDPELQEMIDPNDYQHFIDLLRGELND